MHFLLIVLALIIVFFAGVVVGERAGVKATEQRWHDAATRYETYAGNIISGWQERAIAAEGALKKHVEDALRRKAASAPHPGIKEPQA